MSIKLSKPGQELGATSNPSVSVRIAGTSRWGQRGQKGQEITICQPFLSQFSARQQGVVLILSRSIGYSMLLDGLGYNIHWAGADLSSIALTLKDNFWTLAGGSVQHFLNDEQEIGLMDKVMGFSGVLPHQLLIRILSINGSRIKKHGFSMFFLYFFGGHGSHSTFGKFEPASGSSARHMPVPSGRSKWIDFESFGENKHWGKNLMLVPAAVCCSSLSIR